MTGGYCSLCGEGGYSGRFGGLKGIYVRNSSNYSNPMDRFGFLCEICLGILTRENVAYTKLERAYLNAIANGDRIGVRVIGGELADLARRKA